MTPSVVGLHTPSAVPQGDVKDVPRSADTKAMTRFDMMTPVWKWSTQTRRPVARRSTSSLRRIADGIHRSIPHPLTLQRWGRIQTRLH
jgi:hypothetical protein